MISTAIFPGRYVQGYEALNYLGEETSVLGNKALVICTPFAYKNLLDKIKIGLANKIDYSFERFNGECSDEEINRLSEVAEEQNVNVIIAVGGGKTIDASKVVAHNNKNRLIIVPTIASTDAPCSAVSVIYHPDGNFKRYVFLPHNPNTVIVDTKIIAHAPVRFLVAGMGDAFATWFEAEDCRTVGALNTIGRQGPMTAYHLARLCHEILLEYGVLAKLSCQQKLVTPALEHVVEANTLLSGLGFESGGIAAAHSIHNGLTVLEETHTYYHGEKVAIGIQAMMFLTDKRADMIDTVYNFSGSVGLPTTLADIGLENVSDDQLMKVAKAACGKGEQIYNEPVEVTPQKVFSSIKMADSEGRRRKNVHAGN